MVREKRIRDIKYMINTLKDNLMLLRDSARSRILYSPRFNMSPAVDTIITHLRLKNHVKCIIKKTSTIMIITDNMVIRVPLDKLSAARCRLNKIMLERLKRTSIASFVPRFLYSGNFEDQVYYCEERLPGYAVDIPITKMDELVLKATDFITKFHKETTREILLNESHFKRLIGREFKRLYVHLNGDYRFKLSVIEDFLKKQLLGKSFKMVWSHGDYNVENILFDTKNWALKGVIDWDLSRREGLPLLDIFYLLAYKNSLLTKRSIVDVFQTSFLNLDFAFSEKEIINRYMHSIGISYESIKAFLLTFWVNHLGRRYYDHLVMNSASDTVWISKNVYNTINMILENK